MEEFINKYREQIHGTLSGFDRLVFRGTLRRRRRSSAISRKLRMLRAHGLIQKVPRTHRYQVTDPGRTILLAVLTVARTSLHQLDQLLKVA
jgi:DNA-binding HxlR family transcriptional regulator